MDPLVADLGRASVLVWLVVLCVCGCGEPAPETSPPPAPVNVAIIAEELRSPAIEVTGTIQAERHAMLRAEAAGRVIHAPFRAGAMVEAGQVVLRLDVSRSESGVAKARAQVARAEAELRQATRAREDVEALSAEGARARATLDQARDRAAAARARHEEALAGLSAARAGFSEAALTAPFDGVLADFRVREGEFVSPGTAVAVLIDPSRLEAELLIDPEEGASAGVGAEVIVRVSRDRVFSGKTVFVGEVLDPRTGRLPVRVEIADPDRTLLPGEVATFTLAVGPARETILLPQDAVVRRDGRTLVYVVKEGRAEARPVRVKEARSSEVELVAGTLTSGEQLIVAGLERVEDGGPVRVVDETLLDHPIREGT